MGSKQLWEHRVITISGFNQQNNIYNYIYNIQTGLSFSPHPWVTNNKAQVQK